MAYSDEQVKAHYVAGEGMCSLMHGSGPLMKAVKHPRVPGRGYRSNGQRLLLRQQLGRAVKVIEVAA